MSEPKATLSVTIMSHPDRRDAARALSRALGDVPVLVDEEKHGPLHNAVRAWRSADPSASHHLVLQDDIRPVPGLIEEFERAAARHPGTVLAGYANWNAENGAAVRLGAVSGASWVEPVHDFYFPMLATAIPVAHLDDYVTYASRYIGMMRHDDFPLARFIREREIPALISAPSLVEHGDDHSVAGNTYYIPLRSACFLDGDTAPALDHDAMVRDFALCPFTGEGHTDFLARVPVGGRDRWIRSHWTDHGERLGLDADEVRALFGRTLRSSSVFTALCEDTHEEFLYNVWLTSFLLGRVVRANGGTGAPDLSPVALAALRTVAIGSLRNVFVPVGVVQDRVDPLHALAVDGHTEGLR
ncbi:MULTISPECIES: hypothetical protein [unclassified Streptomyces]|uniref:hypothetical protein n=1 Tax=unclassified Streptomyces TaxID=2593676 RepID=UPI000DAD9E86|nr:MULTISPECIES: hypothetical protein [unclassified Streptomyces]PZT72144.1 hypothetical protein DNK55_26570 [Streptomyces sp. AC1-42T]PZT81535.1 hypothetical protein DNK56_05005 [Streptomyces sp. AC1-42W]